jgi:hypothetical protein
VRGAVITVGYGVNVQSTALTRSTAADLCDRVDGTVKTACDGGEQLGHDDGVI